MKAKRYSAVRFYTLAISLNIDPKTTKNAEDSSPNHLNIAILAQLEAYWRHLVLNLAPSWTSWERFSSIRGWPKSTKIN